MAKREGKTDIGNGSYQALGDAQLNAEKQVNTEKPTWTLFQKNAFRIAFIYFLLLCIPAYSNFYTHLFGLEFSKITYHDFQSIVAFWPPQIILIESEEGVFGLLNYINLILLFFIALLIGWVWGLIDHKKRRNYSKLYYWVRVIVRYRLAYGMVGWGLKKAFPMQMVYPTVGMLNTPFADMAEKKLYWGHVGVSFDYTVFLGFAEIIPGLLLLHRKTAVLGGALAAVVCFNIAIANHAYDAGVAVPAAYFTLLGIFVAWYDLPKIWNLVVKERDVDAYRYYPALSKQWQRYLRTGLKVVFNILFVPVAAGLWAYGFFYGNNYNIPSTPGLPDTKGYYAVPEFRLNEHILPYNPKDSIRWLDATFEPWSSLSYKTNRAGEVDRMIGYSPLRVRGDGKNTRLNQVRTQDSDRLARQRRNRDLGVTRWEVGGMAGERRYFFYDADTINHILHLQNKNRHHSDERQVLTYQLEGKDRIILSGVNEFQDSIYVALEKINKRYPLVEGRQSKLQTY